MNWISHSNREVLAIEIALRWPDKEFWLVIAKIGWLYFDRTRIIHLQVTLLEQFNRLRYFVPIQQNDGEPGEIPQSIDAGHFPRLKFLLDTRWAFLSRCNRFDVQSVKIGSKPRAHKIDERIETLLQVRPICGQC